MSSGENIFVFVVCGTKEHIDTLHFSLVALKRFSKNRIVIVTDPSRNEIEIEHNEIVDIETPIDFNHHQASIFLKTGLYKFLPQGNNYCYLDTDVVALDDKVDEIFRKYVAPITFCSDHCRINAFSPSAVYCGCIESFQEDNKKLLYYLKDFDENILPKLLYIDQCIEEIESLIASTKKSKWIYQWHKLKYLIPGYYHLNGKYKMDKSTGVWYDQNNTLLKYNLKDNMLYIAEKTGYTYSNETGEWYRQDGTSLTKLTCHHLLDNIKSKFNIAITPPNWQHWNGGVFLFSDTSQDFLECWHKSTLEIFKDKQWRTRDQGSLAKTVWKFNLQNHPTLPICFNFIADYNKETLHYLGDLKFEIDSFDEIFKPHFIHVYHHWGDIGWLVWRDVNNHIFEHHAS